LRSSQNVEHWILIIKTLNIHESFEFGQVHPAAADAALVFYVLWTVA
jgi:hypothetical protein